MDTLLCTFRIADLVLGVDVVDVREVLRAREVTSVPLAGPDVAGLINLRGEIVTALDLRARLGLTAVASDGPAAYVVVDTAEGPVALGVDEVGDVLELSAPDPPPSTLDPVIRALLRGTLPLPDALLLVLDLERLLAPARTPTGAPR